MSIWATNSQSTSEIGEVYGIYTSAQLLYISFVTPLALDGDNSPVYFTDSVFLARTGRICKKQKSDYVHLFRNVLGVGADALPFYRSFLLFNHLVTSAR